MSKLKAKTPTRRRRPSPLRGRTVKHIPIPELMTRLEPLYGPPNPPRPYDPLSELIFTVLSQHTSDINSYRAFAKLKETFPTWEQVLDADVEALAESIKMGGLSKVKAPRLQEILTAVLRRNGSWDISFLGEMPLPEAKKWLLELPGVGPKTVGCVLLFSLGMPAMIVDTHVHRVAKRLNLIGPKVSADDAHDILEAKVPPDDVLGAHIYIIAHGRQVCKAQRPLCDLCVLEDQCPSSELRRNNRGKTSAA